MGELITPGPDGEESEPDSSIASDGPSIEVPDDPGGSWFGSDVTVGLDDLDDSVQDWPE